MAKTEQIAHNVTPETKRMIDELAELTLRGKGDVIEWAVRMAYIATKNGIGLDELPKPDGGQSVPVLVRATAKDGIQ